MIGRHMWLTLAVVIALEIGDVTRFPTTAKLASYAGYTCRVHASGDNLRDGRLRPDVNRDLKWASDAADPIKAGKVFAGLSVGPESRLPR
jgi:Transposase IS116/IS110/IS902 family